MLAHPQNDNFDLKKKNQTKALTLQYVIVMPANAITALFSRFVFTSEQLRPFESIPALGILLVLRMLNLIESISLVRLFLLPLSFKLILQLFCLCTLLHLLLFLCFFNLF